MCGINGIYHMDKGKVSIDTLKSMNDSMIFRGPDDEGYYLSKSFGMAMRRLSIIDLKTGSQPIYNEDKTISVICNGEIYNYLELRKMLKDKGYIFKTNTDTEVLVHLYQEFKLDAVKYLNGMYAFALWDNNLERLWIARDRLGIKPLYYFIDKEKFAFSSNLSSLVNIPNFNKKLDVDSFLLFFALAYIPTPKTIWENVYKLPPAHSILVEKDNIKINKYWDLDYNINENNNYVENIYELLNDSIALHSRSDVPVGTFLSGGLDSSAITGLFCKKTNKSVDTFSMDFDQKKINEGKYAKLVSELYQTNHHSYSLNLDTSLEIIDELLPYMDEPMADSAIIPTFFLSKKASEQGIKVLLSGAGGDEIFGGYSRHYKKFRDFIIGKNILFNKINSMNPKIFHYKTLIDNKALNFATSTSGIYLGAYINLFNDPGLFKRMVSLTNKQFSNINQLEKQWGFEYSRMILDIKNYLVDNILALTDKASMAVSLEARVPFLDYRLLELAFSVPSKSSLKNNYKKNKHSLKIAVKSDVPKEIVNRSKLGFNAPIPEWVGNNNEKIKNRLFNLKNGFISEVINKSTINNLLENTDKRKQSSETLFMIYIMDKWLEKHG